MLCNGSDLSQQDRYPFTLPRMRHVMNLAGRVRCFCTSMKDMHGLRVFFATSIGLRASVRYTDYLIIV